MSYQWGGSIACSIFIMTVLAMIRRFEKLDTDLVIVHSMQQSEQDIRDINLEQMYDGKNNLGVDITPSYLNDPYWDDHGGRPAAQAYSDWKDKITPNPRRTPGTPNLFINGYFHSSLSVLVKGDSVIWNSSFNAEPDIRSRFKHIYGLGGRYKKIFLKDYLAPILSEKVYDAVGLKMKLK